MLLFVQFTALSILYSIFRRHSSSSICLFNELSENSALENIALQKLREALSDVRTEDYESSDEYLLRWLKLGNFNQKVAEDMFRKAKIWRSNINMTEPVHSHYSGVITIGGADNEGSTANLDVRKEILLGHSERMLRYFYQSCERAFKRSIEEWRKFPNQGLKQVVSVADYTGFTIKQFGCWECLKWYLEYVPIVYQIYPFAGKSLIVINAPPSANIMLNKLGKIVPSDVRVRIFGSNTGEGTRYLQSIIPEENLPKEYGGTMAVVEAQR